jgi:CTP synthase (UTP-ammonia lyase)
VERHGTTGSRKWIAVIGDRIGDYEPQDAMRGAVNDAADTLGIEIPELRWIATEQLEGDGTKELEGASAAWCAPGGPFRSLEGALVGIRWARESGLPFLGTCAGFQHAVIEYARNVLNRGRASHAEYGRPVDGDLIVDELLCSVVGKTMEVEVLDPEIVALYGTSCPKERYYCRFGLHPDWRLPLEQAGLAVAGVDAEDDDVRIMRLVGHPYFVLTLFVPQTSSSPEHPHPLIVGLLKAAVA